ncbi:hypothetical protein FRB91_008502, partial [Serendipita sp. 411]
MDDHQHQINTTTHSTRQTHSIPSSPGSSSLPSPPSSPPQHHQQLQQLQPHQHQHQHRSRQGQATQTQTQSSYGHNQAATVQGTQPTQGAHNTQYDSLPESPALSVASSFPSGASSYMFSQSATSSPPHLDPALLNELGYN